MNVFVDTLDGAEIKSPAAPALPDGVTANPLLIAKSD